MTKEEVLSRLYDRYIRPTEQKRGNYIGVEIEMPIVNLNNEAVDFEVIHQLTAVFLEHFAFVPVGFDEAGHIYSAVNKENGDVFSYDCSYNNMEFSFGKEETLHEIHRRFLIYYDFVQAYFEPDHTVNTLNSTRQDAGTAPDWRVYYSCYLYMALRTCRADFAWIADEMLRQSDHEPLFHEQGRGPYYDYMFYLIRSPEALARMGEIGATPLPARFPRASGSL